MPANMPPSSSEPADQGGELLNPLLVHPHAQDGLATPRLSSSRTPILEYSWPCWKFDMLVFSAVYWATGISVLLIMLAKSIEVQGELRALFVIYFGVGIFLAICCPCHVRQYHTHCQLRVGLVGQEVEESQIGVP
ncbi:hypothetical protein BSKO_06153 [Bryopsis sp. KO-2023]|nr:hypothetical protein BSKO_06153 [Bryopsis sp. KO-2023]